MHKIMCRAAMPLVGFLLILWGPQAHAAVPPPNSLAPMLARVSPGVVNISVKGHMQAQQNPLFQDPFFRQFFNTPRRPEFQKFQALGSGVIMDAKHGYVLTNNHVIAHADQIVVILKNHRKLKAKLIGTDPQTDVAVLKIKPDHLTAVPLGNSDKLRVGDYVAAIGDPFGVGQTATFGIVSALGRTGLGIEKYEDFIQTDASINPGNSGGALVNMNGKLIGLNTAILSRSGGNVGIGFAIPINMVEQVAEQLIAHGKVRRGELGVIIQNMTPALADAMGIKATGGAIISQVLPHSPAAKAGMKAGDVITALNGKAIPDSAELRNQVSLMPPGTTVTFTIERNGKQRTLTARLEPQSKAKAQEEQKGPSESPLAGAFLGAIPPDNPLYGKVKGVYVLSVQSNSDAASAGLQAGDIITAVDRQQVSTPEQVGRIVRENRGKPLLLNIQRGNMSLFLAIG